MDSISGDMDGKAVQGSVLGELDPSRPVYIIRMYNNIMRLLNLLHAASCITFNVTDTSQL